MFLIDVDSTTWESGKCCARRVAAIRVFVDNSLVQEIAPPDECLFEERWQQDQVFVVEDVNFDGHVDLRLLSWYSISDYTTFWYWLFDPRTERFVRDTAMDKIMNPSFDPLKKEVRSWWRIGFNEFGRSRHTWEKERSVLQWSEVMTTGFDGFDGPVYLDRTQRINGELVRKEILLKPEEIERYLTPSAGDH